MKVEQKKLPKSQVELEFELTPEEFAEHTEHALEHLKLHVKVDGFREGKAPAKLVEDKIKPEALLMEAGDHAIQHAYSDYVKKNKLEAVGHPEIQIIKIAKGNPFIFRAVVTVLPDVELPDYKEIAMRRLDNKSKEISVTEQEVQDSLNYIQKSRAKFSLKTEPAEKKDFVEIKYQNKDINEGKEVDDKFILGEGGFMKGFEDNIIGMKNGEEKTFTAKFPDNSPRKDLANKEGEFKVKLLSAQKMELPEINDEFAKQLGAFDSLAALKISIREGLNTEKREVEKQKRRAEILEKIAEKSKFPASGGELPETLIEQEQQNLLNNLKRQVVRAGISWENYLASVKKTEEEIKQTYQKEAEKRLREFLVLRELGKRENIEVSDQEIEEEINKNLKGQTIQQVRGKFDTDELKEYTKGVIRNEKIFQLLENLSR